VSVDVVLLALVVQGHHGHHGALDHLGGGGREHHPDQVILEMLERAGLLDLAVTAALEVPASPVKASLSRTSRPMVFRSVMVAPGWLAPQETTGLWQAKIDSPG
jgi:hypothetical protein